MNKRDVYVYKCQQFVAIFVTPRFGICKNIHHVCVSNIPQYFCFAQSHDKIPFTNKKFIKRKVPYQKATPEFDYPTIVELERSVDEMTAKQPALLTG